MATKVMCRFGLVQSTSASSRKSWRSAVIPSLLTSFVAMITIPTFAHAEPQAAEPQASADAADIVVTAQKRSEKLQTTALSVQPLSGQTLESRSLRNIEDLARFIPSLGVSGVGFQGQRTVVLRGIAPSGGTEPTVITYLDDVLIPSTVDPQIYDIARVEVLKGPQGDLYGASAAGGIIRYVSSEPNYREAQAKGELSGSSTAGGGSNYGAAAAINLPLGDRIALRASGVYDRRGGFVDNYDPARGRLLRDVNAQKRATGRVVLGVRFADDVTANFSVMYNDRRVDGRAESDLSLFLPQGSPAARTTSRFHAEPLTGKAWVANATFNVDLDWGTIISSTGYVHERLTASNDINSVFLLNPDLFDGYSYPGFDPSVDGPFATNLNTALLTPSNFQQTTRRLTQELRFASSWDFPIQLLIGGFYLRDRVRRSTQNGFTAPIPEYATGVYGGDPNSLIEVGERTRFATREIAAFGNLSWKFAADRGELKLGMRHYDRRGESATVDVPTALYSLAGSGFVKSTGQLYSGTASFRLSRDWFVYSRYSQGFRPGESRATLPPICDRDFATLGIDRSSLSPFTDPEKLRNVEGGLRFTSRNQTFSGSLTGFRMRYDGIQQSIVLPVCGSGFVVNGGAATSKGVEASASVSPIRGLTFNFDVGYTDSRFDTSSPSNGIDRGERLQYVPEWTWAVRGDYRFPLHARLDGILRGDVTFTDTRQTTFGGVGSPPDRATSLPAFALVGLQAGVAYGRWELVATATNLFDETPIYGNFVERYATLSPLYRTFQIGPPRTIGLRLSMSY